MDQMRNGLEILKASGDCDNLNAATIEDVLKDIEMTKREKIINQHKTLFTVWEGKNGMWYTYFPDDSKPHGRRQVKAVTEEKLHNKIVDFYQKKESSSENSTITLRDFYPLWLKFKALHTNASTYIRKIDADWNRYYQTALIVDVPLKKLTYPQLDEWANGMVKTEQLTKKQYYNMSVIMRQALAYAVDCKILKENPFEQVHVFTKLFKTVKKPQDQTQVFLVEEQPLIVSKAFEDYEKHNNTAPLAIVLCFEIGCRIGEIVAIKFSDIDEELKNHIHIQRMDVRDFQYNDDGTWTQLPNKVVEHTKSEEGNRNTYLSVEARRILGLIKE